MLKIVTTTTCEAGHTQELTFLGMPHEWVEQWCGLVDGTSDLYQAKPCDDPRSVIGKCCWPVDGKPCGKQIKAVIVGESNEPEGAKP